MLISNNIRLKAFELAGVRAEPIIVAIEKYKEQNNTIPDNITNLTPIYLDKIPSRIPKLEIFENGSNNQWGLRADAYTGMLNWDEFIYSNSK